MVVFFKCTLQPDYNCFQEKPVCSLSAGTRCGGSGLDLWFEIWQVKVLCGITCYVLEFVNGQKTSNALCVIIFLSYGALTQNYSVRQCQGASSASYLYPMYPGLVSSTGQL